MNSSPPAVSIVVPVYNGVRLLPAALESAFKQTFQDFEIIVVDDGSTDGTRELLASYGDRIRAFHQQNGGASSARNHGIREARGEYIAFLDSDDLWQPEKLAIQMVCLREHPDAGVCFTDLNYFDERNQWSAEFKRVVPPSGMMFDAILRNHFISMSSVVVRRKCLDEVGLFDESLIGCEDYNLFLRLAQRYPFQFIAQPLIESRCHEGNLSNNLPQMCRDEIANVDKIAAMFPEMRIPRQELRHEIYYRFGQYHFDASDFKLARDCFASAIRCKPLSPRAYIYWLAAVLPESLLQSLRNLLRSLKGARRSHAASSG